MMEASIIFNVLLMLLFCKMVRGNDYEIDTNECFHVMKDLKQVEEEAVNYARNQQSSKFAGLHLDVRKNICKVSPNLKLTFCGEVLNIDYYGLEFHIIDDYNPACKIQSFFVNHIAVQEKTPFQLPMFTCPPLLYIDLETGEKISFPSTYQVARAKHHQDAIVFSQAQGIDMSYPYRHITQISFENLKKKSKSTVISLVDEVQEQSSIPSIGNEIIYYAKAKQTAAAYRKYRWLYYSFGLCALRGSHIIHLCRQSVEYHTKKLKIIVEGYRNEGCIKHQVQFGHNSEQNHELFLIKCPPTAYTTKDGDELRETTLYYLASSLIYGSLILLSRPNENGGKITALSVIEKMDFRSIIKFKRLARILPYYFESKKSEIISSEEEDNRKLNKYNEPKVHSYLNTVQMPTTIEKTLKWSFELALKSPTGVPSHKLIRNPWMADDSLIALSQVKKIKFVYRRFRVVYWSLDICQLSSKQKKDLCDWVLRDEPYELVPRRKDQNFYYSCRRQKITMTTREAENLTSNEFAIWTCHSSANHYDRIFHLGKSPLRNTAILYRSSSRNIFRIDQSPIYPDALIIKINRNTLAGTSLTEEYKLQILRTIP